MWYTPNANVADSAWNGFCTEYCGASHANMRIRAYTVTPEHFEQWVAGQRAPVAFTATPAPAPPPAAKGLASAAPTGGVTVASAGLLADQATQTAPAPQTTTPPPAPVVGWYFPKENLPSHVVPKTPLPKNLAFDDALLASGDAARGEALFKTKGACGGCHLTIVTDKFNLAGPNLTHIASRHTIASGMYPNDPPYVARWLKNSLKMKPGSLMQVLGEGEIDPKTKQPTMMGKLTDAEIADIVAYLGRLK
jgi:cytochrome c oxidase subunit 2